MNNTHITHPQILCSGVKMLNIFYSHLFSTDAINLPSDEATPIIKLWVLRIFIKLRAHHGFIRKDDFENEATASFLGLDKWLNQPDDFSDKGVKHDLLKAYKTSEISASDTKAPKQLRKNINKLSKELGLSKTDCRILEFIVLLKIEVILNQSTNLLGTLSTSDISKVIAVILSLPVSMVQFLLRAKGALQESGLLSIEMGKYSLTGKLELISDDFSDSIYSSKATEPMELLQKVLFKSLKPELNINDFKHMNKELDILSPYLSYALKNNRKAVNFYIHGQPGTGKTQLVRVLAKELGYELFEISSRDEDDKPIDGFSRLKAYQVAQSVLKNKKAIILFDEVEDIFSD
ncbi:MAG TPA: AAA family ATPase, partial [Leucothrix sp.]|nr:AAA family ATPase [Leucothrix sp.]